VESVKYSFVLANYMHFSKYINVLPACKVEPGSYISFMLTGEVNQLSDSVRHTS